MAISNRSSTDGKQPGDGNALVLWAYGEECLKIVRSELKRAHLVVSDVLVEDVAEAVLVSLIRHVNRNPGRTYDNIPGYVRVTARHVVTRVVSGRDPVQIDDADLPEMAVDEPENEILDSARVYIEQEGGPSWLVGAALAYVTLGAYENLRPDEAPWPQAGAKYATALGWPSLWLAGVRDVFPTDGKDGRKKRRNRWIRQVAARAEMAVVLARKQEV